MLWQRKVELEREINDVLTPMVGSNLVGATKHQQTLTGTAGHAAAV